MEQQTTEALAAELRQIHNGGWERAQLSGLSDTEASLVAILDVAKHVQGLIEQAGKAKGEPAHQVAASAVVAEKMAQLEEAGRVMSELQHNLAVVSRERDNYRAALEAWQEKTEWAQQTAIGSELGKHRADVMRERIDALQRSRDELSKRLADEQRLHIKVDGLQGAGAETLQRCLNAFRANRGTPVRLAGDDAIRVFQLAIPALYRPGELGEIVGHLRLPAAAVQSTSERLTNLLDRKTEG